jgi:hypothetical protein
VAISVRSCLTAGVATITAAAVVFGPAVQPPTPVAPPPVVHVASPPVVLTAAVQPLAAASVPNLLAGWLERIIVPPSAGQPFPTPTFPPVVSGNGIDSTIKNVYNAIEPWVRYGFELATYAVGWIPYVGWLSGQIMIFYNFGERIARSITFNIADWLGGNVSFGQGLINVGVDTINSFIQLGIDEWNYFLPPLPPLPPFPLTAAATAKEDVTALKAADTTQVDKKLAEAPDADPAGDPTGTTEKEPKTVRVKVAKEPKASEEQAAATEVSAPDASAENPTQPTKGADGQKKPDKGLKVKHGTDATDSSAADDGTKHAGKGDKKDDNSKKDKKGAKG